MNVFIKRTTAIFTLQILTLLIFISSIGQSSYAASAYKSGYNHGCSDAKISNPSDRYINQPENGSSFHTNAFMNGYNDGFSSCSGQSGGNFEPTDNQQNDNQQNDNQQNDNQQNDNQQNDNQQNDNQQNHQSSLTERLCNAVNSGSGTAIIAGLHALGLATGGTLNTAIIIAQGYCALRGLLK